ncbi:MAG TPA: tetratricopeptide repeat protein [Candidatus Polarisedimenticolaceae bacterium]|nr:tetratricopeptide repeat protein [Candidatus Polarisedimenticolaceae bacterium]
MKRPSRVIRGALLLAVCWAWSPDSRTQSDDGVIRLRPRPVADPAAGAALDPAPAGANSAAVDMTGPRRGFDYHAFETRLESLWFQRKTLVADGRVDDASEQSELIKAFCIEEGVHHLDDLAGALVAEAERYVEQGHYERAVDALALAEVFDPGRAQVHLARADLHWQAGHGSAAAARELLLGLRHAVASSLREMSLFSRVLLVALVAAVGCFAVFSLSMLVRYQIPFRHEVEEWVRHNVGERWARALGWFVLCLPLATWAGAGWVALYWVLITIRFMRPAERLTAFLLLIVTALALPLYRTAVGTYGVTADPVVRTTLQSAEGEYDPDTILSLRKLVQAHPNDPVYRFLLAGLYKNGRYYEDAFAEYKEALALDPALEQAHINIGNIFFATGQYAEAIASYNEAIAIDPRSVLAYFNRHLAQSESFRFREAEATIEEARAIDADALSELFATADVDGERRTVAEASLGMGSVWQAALGGGADGSGVTNPAALELAAVARQFANPISAAAVTVALACMLLLMAGRAGTPARRCIRCGRPFCHRCNTRRDSHEYCSQCVHLFVLGDGLAAETKTRKLYEVGRHERQSRGARSAVSLVLPGAAQLLRGQAARGVLLVGAWLAAWIAWRPQLLEPLDRLAGVDVRIDLMQQPSVPAGFQPQPLALLALVSLVVVWLSGNAWRWRKREG